MGDIGSSETWVVVQFKNCPSLVIPSAVRDLLLQDAQGKANPSLRSG
jgi:hypothetical protein